MQGKKLGYWDGKSPMIYCTIDSNDRFHFSDKVIKGVVSLDSKGNETHHENLTGQVDPNEIISHDVHEKYRKGCEFFCDCVTSKCFTGLFLEQGEDGAIYFNGDIVFTKQELDLFKKRPDEDWEKDETEDELGCQCPWHTGFYDWQRTHPKRLWLLAYVHPDNQPSDPNEPYVLKNGGIRFNTGTETITVGIDGAWVCLYVPV